MLSVYSVLCMYRVAMVVRAYLLLISMQESPDYHGRPVLEFLRMCITDNSQELCKRLSAG